ncbi:MAG: GIY-YIG nuclease family protein [Dehalococcoidales bacterium]|jgi:putative endonuclease|nr:GIY-YIG nuclease family protein [Dehalococcoidales bacterium]
MLKEKYWVYVLQNPHGQLYIGYTADLEKRLAHHLNGDSRWTRNRGPWSLVYSEEYSSRTEALKRERQQ